MSAPFPLGYTIEVERDIDGPNVHGDLDWTVVGEIESCTWAPRYSTEDNTGRSTVITGLSLFGPYGADLRSTDRVVLPELPELPADRKRRTYRVVGDIGNWRNPFTGWTPGFEAALERVS